MVQLNSDFARQKELMNASLSAKREGALHNPSPLYERLAQMHAKEARRKKRGFPWFTTITVLSIIPFVVGGGGDEGMDLLASVMKEQRIIAPEQRVHGMMADAAENETATVSVTIGGQTVSKELSVSDIQKMQMMSEISE